MKKKIKLPAQYTYTMIEKGEILSSLLVFIVSKTGNWDCTIFHERYMFGKFSFDYIPTHKKKC